MTWFAAHIIIGMKKKNSHQGPIAVYENVVLIEANTSDEAHSRATQIGVEEAELDDKLAINDQPAFRIFAGIRKIITIMNPWEHDPGQDSRQPTTGTEITYSEFEVENDDDLYRLGRGEPLSLWYEE